MNKNNKMTWFDWFLLIGFMMFFIGGAIVLPMRIVTLAYVYHGFISWQNFLAMGLAWFTMTSGYEFFKSVNKKGRK